MFVKVNYAGFYSLGSDAEINNVKIMQCEWREYKKLVFLYGKKTVVNPFYLQLFYVVSKDKVVFFAAHEHGLGHYHIFTANDKAREKLIKNIDFNNQPEVKDLFDRLDSMIENYHKSKQSELKAYEVFDAFWKIHKYICFLEEQGKIDTNSNKSISYLKEILVNDGPEYALIINFNSKSYPKRKYRIGVCVRGEPLIEKQVD